MEHAHEALHCFAHEASGTLHTFATLVAIASDREMPLCRYDDLFRK